MKRSSYAIGFSEVRIYVLDVDILVPEAQARGREKGAAAAEGSYVWR